MVLNEAFVRSRRAGRQGVLLGHDLDIVRDEHAAVVSATAKADGLPVAYEGWTTMSKSKNNGVDPQDLIDALRRRHRAPVRDVRLAAGADARVERRRRRGRAPLPQARVGFRPSQQAGDPRRGAPASWRGPTRRARPRSLRREVHSVLRQVSYDYERMQYNTVVSGAMKLLNALEGFKGGRVPAVAARGAAASCCACSTRPVRT